MKIVPLAEAKNELSAYVDKAQGDQVLITRHGKPAVLMIGVEGEDLEDLMTRADPHFWQMIAERRQTSKTISEGELRKRLGLPSAKSAPRRPPPRSPTSSKPARRAARATR
jgi:prevent-host-death family protein